jgi:hypothetical protein
LFALRCASVAAIVTYIYSIYSIYSIYNIEQKAIKGLGLGTGRGGRQADIYAFVYLLQRVLENGQG